MFNIQTKELGHFDVAIFGDGMAGVCTAVTAARQGARVDENGKNIPEQLVDTEGIKYYFDKICTEAGVQVLFGSQLSAFEMDGENIAKALITTECGNYTLTAQRKKRRMPTCCLSTALKSPHSR